MSTRQLRRIREKLQPPTVETNEDSEDDFEPTFVSREKSRFELHASQDSTQTEDTEESGIVNKMSDSFSLLTTESPQMSEQSEDQEDIKEPMPGPSQKKKKNNKKKNKKRDRRALHLTDEHELIDEVERAVAAVNLLLGVPVAVEKREVAPDPERSLLRIDAKFLSAEEELNRRFGPDEDERRHQRPDIHRQLKRQIKLPDKNYNFSVIDLSIKEIAVKDGVRYFRFEHGPGYDERLRGLMEAIAERQRRHIAPPESHVFNMILLEAVIENVDLYFQLEEMRVARLATESAIHYLQGNFFPPFNYYDGKSRLEYVYVENRPFHIILLKYLHILTNSVCHRTALEIAKILLNIDPSDPLGIIVIIDTLALRAREHQWLVNLYNHWSTTREAGDLFNMIYSYALAKYHIYLRSKKRDDLAAANESLRRAIIAYPNMAAMLMQHCHRRCPDVENSNLITTIGNESISEALLTLQRFYVAVGGPKWRESQIMKWFIPVAKSVCMDYDSNDEIKAACEEAARKRNELFQRIPQQIKRHMYLIRTIPAIIESNAVPALPLTYSFNPYPNEGSFIDDHGYFSPRRAPVPPSAWRAFMESIVPQVPPNLAAAQPRGDPPADL